MRVLAVSDEVVERLWCARLPGGGTLDGFDLVLAAGDLPFDYLEHLGTALDRPCVFVPGNHDPDLSGYTAHRGMWLHGGLPVRWPGHLLLTHAPPRGCGDQEDPPHQGFDCLHDVVSRLRPGQLLHGHVHPYGHPAPDRMLGHTRVVNVVGCKVLEVT